MTPEAYLDRVRALLPVLRERASHAEKLRRLPEETFRDFQEAGLFRCIQPKRYKGYELDPDGHCIQLYYYMEQVGWDGRVRPLSSRRQIQRDWPEALEPLSDTYVDQVFQGPLG